MIKSISAFFIGALSLYLSTAHAEKSMSVIAKCSGGAFVVKLPANPTTGYQWAAPEFDTTQFQLKSQRYVAPKTRSMGAGGNTLFTFQSLKGGACPKNAVMLFRYVRPWDPKSATQTTVHLEFK